MIENTYTHAFTTSSRIARVQTGPDKITNFVWTVWESLDISLYTSFTKDVYTT
jgi:hypothetical protein